MPVSGVTYSFSYSYSYSPLTFPKASKSESKSKSMSKKLASSVYMPTKKPRLLMRPRNASSSFAKARFPDHQQIRDKLATLANQAMQQDPNIEAVYLFGSRATGNFSARSDADLLIIVQNDSQRPIDRIPHHLQLFLKSPVPVEVFPYTRDEIRQNAFAQRALKEGVLLSRRPGNAAVDPIDKLPTKQ